MPGVNVEARASSSRLETVFLGARRGVDVVGWGGEPDASVRCSYSSEIVEGSLSGAEECGS
jgi:hypothetical protein